MAKNEVHTEDIAPGGDVVLLVGNPTQAKLRVSSATLKRTSKVFEAMLSSKYREGQDNGTSARPKEIKLPEDAASATSDMCNLLHGNRFEERQHMDTSEQILSLSVAIDKYDCTDALYYQNQGILLMWLDKHQKPCLTEAGEIAAASYLLRQPRAFEIATQRLAESTSGDFLYLLKDECGKILPTNVFLNIERRRTMAYEKIAIELPLLGMPNCYNCEYDGNSPGYGTKSINYDQGYMDRLCEVFKVSAWPPNLRKLYRGVAGTFETIRRIDTVILRLPTCEHTGIKQKITGGDLKNFTDDIAKLCYGMCLQCVKDGNDDFNDKCNDVEHEQKPF